MSIAHVAEFAQMTKDKLLKDTEAEYARFGGTSNASVIKEVANEKWKEVLTDAIQTMQYQLSSIASSNGQSPFCTLSLDIDEFPEYSDVVSEIISEIFTQRAIGVKNADGVYEPVEFPKLFYVLNENNTYENSKYFWLTQEAATCWTKSMAPDFGSTKISKQITGSDFTVPPMGKLSA